MDLHVYLYFYGLTVLQFAKKSGLAWKTLYNYLQFKTLPRIETLITIFVSTNGEVDLSPELAKHKLAIQKNDYLSKVKRDKLIILEELMTHKKSSFKKPKLSYKERELMKFEHKKPLPKRLLSKPKRAD